MNLKHFKPIFAEIARNKQTTGLGHVTVEDMKHLFVVKPDSKVLYSWNEVVNPLIERIFQSEIESLMLAGLRDALLPKLISGELRVADAERIVGRCV